MKLGNISRTGRGERGKKDIEKVILEGNLFGEQRGKERCSRQKKPSVITKFLAQTEVQESRCSRNTG